MNQHIDTIEPVTIDKEVVIKNFSGASETDFILLYVLQLFLAIEEERTHDAYGIEDQSVFALCDSPSRLPQGIRDFILWQTNIMKRDNGEIIALGMPKGLTKKYAVKQARLAEMEDDAVRVATIQDCIDEIEIYMAAFNETRAILEAVEDHFATVEDVLLRAESMNDDLARRLKPQKKVVEEMRMAITDLRGVIEDDIMPDTIKFKDVPLRAWTLMKTLSDCNLKTRDAIRLHDIAQDDDEDEGF
ncbi:MAG: hypothetical protein ACPGRX_01230 [Bdellovibrionales bacterium]